MVRRTALSTLRTEVAELEQALGMAAAVDAHNQDILAAEALALRHGKVVAMTGLLEAYDPEAMPQLIRTATDLADARHRLAAAEAQQSNKRKAKS